MIPQGHDGGGQRDAGDGIETGKVGENKMNGCKDHDEVGGFDRLAVSAQKIMDLLQGLPTCDHVHYVHANFHHQLLGHHYPKPKLFSKSMLTQLMVPVKPLPFHHFMHFHHLPQGIQSDDP